MRSQLGQGTTFRIEIPLQACEAALPTTNLETKARPKFREVCNAETIRVLVAEDQAANRLLLVTILRKAGFEVHEAINGRIAVDQWETIRPHVTFMDLNMPELNGETAATRLILDKHRHESPVIVALTASALEETKTLMLGAGCQDFLTNRSPQTSARLARQADA